jgi:hypothetical protein
VAKQYWPERLEIIGEMPRTQTGKVQKFVLREQILALIEDEGPLTPTAMPADAAMLSLVRKTDER